MERLELRRREPDSRDRRQKYIDITERGRALAEEIDGEVLAAREPMLDGLSPADLKTGIALFEKILDNAGEKTVPAAPTN